MINEGRLLKHIFCIVAAVFLVALASSDVRAAHRGSLVPISAGPVLQNVSDNFGSETPANLGSVFLASQDIDYGTGFIPKGFDALVSGSCAKYSTAITGGTASHWNVASHVVSASARTPSPTAAGVSAHLNAGPYTIRIDCEDASNNVLTSKNLTRTIIPNAVSFGTGDRNFSNWPAGFGTIAGAKFLFSTGFVSNAAALGLTFGPFATNVIVTWADTAKPGSMNQLTTGVNTGNITLKDMTFTGSTVSNNGQVVALNGQGTSPINMDNVHAFYKSTTPNIGNLQFLSGGITGGNGAAGGTINNVGCNWCGTGASALSHYTMSNVVFRYFQNNCWFIGSVTNVEIDDPVCASPQGNIAFHQDTFQFCDGCTPHDINFKRVLIIQADGNNTTQGLYFGGAVLGQGGSVTPNPTGYISAGAGLTTPGKVLTFVTGSLDTGSNGSTIFSSDAGAHAVGFGVQDNAIMTCAGGSNCGGQTSATLALASNINLGTAGAPVPIYGKQAYNINIDQVAYIGYTINGLTMGSNYDNYNYSNFAFVYTQYATQASLGGTVGGGINNCNQPEMHQGTSTMDGGFFWSGLGYNYVVGASHFTCAVPPASFTITNVLNGSNNPATIAPLFLNGNPQTVPQNTSFATYAAMSIGDLKALACNTLQAAPASAYAGHSPFISGGWKDGTLIAGCS